MALVLVIDGVYTRAGMLSKTFPIVGQIKPPAPWERLTQFGVLIHWDRNQDWLHITGRYLPQGGAPIRLADDLAGLDSCCAKHEVARDRLTPPAFLESRSFLVTSLPSANQIELTIQIDTDSPKFREVVESHRDPTTSNVVFPVSLLYFDQKQFKQYVQKAAQLDLSFKPCQPLPKFNGALAIDLGNTVSSMASLSESSRVYDTEEIQIVPVDPLTDTPTMLTTALRIDEVLTPERGNLTGTRRLPSLPSDDTNKMLRFVVGRAAVAGSAGTLEGVVVGVKQLLSVPAYELGHVPKGKAQHFPLNILHTVSPGGVPQIEQMEVMNHFPGELVFSQLIVRFRTAAKAWPADLVLTYPTTYTRGELKQLVTAAARGWLRAMQQPQSLELEPEASGDPELDRLVLQVRGWVNHPGRMTDDCPVVRLCIDEATAAGFFHVHRRVFEKPGALARFRYLQPDGSHTLVIDCGGGTTDVVLIHATSPTKKSLKLDILARTGMRSFGGDHITREVCRILKAKLTVVVAKTTKPAAIPSTGLQLPATGPSDPAQARAALDKFFKIIEGLSNFPQERELVPTRFDLNNLSAESSTARAAFQALWRLGDEIKRKLSDGKAVKLNQLDKQFLQKETSALIRAIYEGLTPQIQTQLSQQFGDITIHPWEVDALVYRPINELINKCNKLIAKKVKRLPNGSVPEVDWVVLSGNGARYPLIQSLCKQRLHVAFLNDETSERFTFDTANLKFAVAKGAVMARLMSRVARTATVEYPPNLSERLPFAVGRQELDTGIKRTIFQEFTLYSDLMHQSAALTLESAPPGQGQTVVLERQFPGDEGWAPFASYHFPNGVSSQVEAIYDNDENRFRLSAEGEESIYEDLTNPLEHVSPQNRGDF